MLSNTVFFILGCLIPLTFLIIAIIASFFVLVPFNQCIKYADEIYSLDPKSKISKETFVDLINNTTSVCGKEHITLLYLFINSTDFDPTLKSAALEIFVDATKAIDKNSKTDTVDEKSKSSVKTEENVTATTKESEASEASAASKASEAPATTKVPTASEAAKIAADAPSLKTEESEIKIESTQGGLNVPPPQ